MAGYPLLIDCLVEDISESKQQKKDEEDEEEEEVRSALWGKTRSF